jgi:hypothetical protein
MRVFLLLIVMLLTSANVYAIWERQQDIPGLELRNITENYYNYDADRAVALVIYRGNIKYEEPPKDSDSKKDKESPKIVSKALITVAIMNAKENWTTSRRSQYGTIKIDGKSWDIEFLVNSAKSVATIVVEDGVNGDENSQALARAIYNANKISIDASSIGGKYYSFSK